MHDCGRLYLPEEIHSYIKAEAEAERLDLMALCRDIVVAHVEKRLHILSFANSLHESKGFGKIQKD